MKNYFPLHLETISLDDYGNSSCAYIPFLLLQEIKCLRIENLEENSY